MTWNYWDSCAIPWATLTIFFLLGGREGSIKKEDEQDGMSHDIKNNFEVAESSPTGVEMSEKLLQEIDSHKEKENKVGVEVTLENKDGYFCKKGRKF